MLINDIRNKKVERMLKNESRIIEESKKHQENFNGYCIEKESDSLIFYGVCFKYKHNENNNVYCTIFVQEEVIYRKNKVITNFLKPIIGLEMGYNVFYEIVKHNHLINLVNLGEIDFIEALHKMYGSYFCKEFNMIQKIEMKTIYDFSFNYMCLSKEQEYRTFELCDYTELNCTAINNLGCQKNIVLTAAYIQKIGEVTSVVRIFSGCNGKIWEHSRILTIDDKSTFLIKGPNGFYPTNNISSKNFDFAIAGTDNIENMYVGYCFNNGNSQKMCLSLYARGLENLCKMDMENIYQWFMSEQVEYEAVFYMTLLEKLNYLGIEDFNANSFSKMIGISQHILEVINEIPDTIFFIPWFKKYKEWFNSIDKDTCRRLLKICVSIQQKTSRDLFSLIDILVWGYGKKNIMSYFQYVSTLSSSQFNYYVDYIDMLVENNLETYGMHWKIKPSQIREYHNRATEIINALDIEKEEQTYSKLFTKQSKKWNKYIFKGSSLSVIAPNKVEDIILEGSKLHHCVKSYLNKICDGTTTVMFIRKNNEIDKPYYTLEIRDNKIRQCHGLQNCNIDKTIEEFLRNYCEEKQIEYGNPTDLLMA